MQGEEANGPRKNFYVQIFLVINMNCISLLRLSKVYIIFLDSDLYFHYSVVHTCLFI